MLLGGWGGRSLELLSLVEQSPGRALDRVGSAAVAGAAGATAGHWRCWVSGRVTNLADLWEMFPGPGPVDLAAAMARAHSRLGPAAGDLLRGTFVIVAVDLERDAALVSRDQLGGQPLVYARVGDGALFAEHERDLLDLLPSAPGPDRLAVTGWIDGRGIPAEHTLYDGIRRLPAAHRLVLAKDGVSARRYWSPRYEGTVPGSRDEIGERLRSEVFAAVERAAAGPGRVAVRLSGGLDSAAVAAGLAARKAPAGDAMALSAVFPHHPETDEADLIEAVASKVGIPSERIPFDDGASILAPALRHIDRWRLPPMSPNLFVWEPVVEQARRLGVDVMLDGEGGDELFGLAPYLIADMLRAGRFAKAWSLTGGIPGMGESPDPRLRLRALRVFGVGGLVPPGARRWRRRRSASTTVGSLLAPPDLTALADLDGDTRGRELGGPIWWRSLAAKLTEGGTRWTYRDTCSASGSTVGSIGATRFCSTWIWSRPCSTTHPSCSSTRSVTGRSCAMPSPATSPSRCAVGTRRATSRRSCMPRSAAPMEICWSTASAPPRPSGPSCAQTRSSASWRGEVRAHRRRY